MRAIIAAAGTGGHINPGIAIANEIERKEKNSEILFIGTERGIENDLVPRAGYKLKTIEAYGLSKKINLENIKHIIKTLKSINKSKKIIKEFKPDVVIGTGGYICGPVITAANKCGIPTVLHESNSFPGLAVKMLSKKTDVILVGLEKAKENLKDAKKIVVTGTPTKIKKINMSDIEKCFLKEKLDLDGNLPLVLVFGGSQGAKKINDSMIELINNNIILDYQIVWAVGQKNYDEVKKELEKVVKLYTENEENNKIAIASAEVEGGFYGKYTRVEEIMEVAKRIGAKKIGIAT